jgi:hypothetical protein
MRHPSIGQTEPRIWSPITLDVLLMVVRIIRGGLGRSAQRVIAEFIAARMVTGSMRPWRATSGR